VWGERKDGWHRVPGGGAPAAVSAAAGSTTTWVVTEDLDGLLVVTRALARDDRTAPLLDRHLRHDDRDRPHARVDRGPDGQLVLTAPTVSFVPRTREVHTGWITCVLCPGLVVMTEQGDAGVLERAATRLEDDLPNPDEGAYAVAATVLLVLVQTASDIEVEIGDAVALIERTVFSPGATGDVLSEVYDLKREIAEARRALGPVTSVLPELIAEAEEAVERRHSQAWLSRAVSWVDRLDHHLDGYDELLGDMLSVHLSQVSVRQNEDVRKISSWAAIAAAPTLVASIYGMNFRHMPELAWPVGYPLVVVGMAAICGTLYWLFRRSGWL